MMNIQTPTLFVPPRPPVPDVEPGWLHFLRAVRTNGLRIWPKAAYEQDVIRGSSLGRPRFLINAPEAIHRVLVDNTQNYSRTSASIRILRPIVGAGLLLSEGDDWRHQRRTMAPALAPRVIPMLARHVAAVTDETLPRWEAAAGGEPLDLLAALQFLTLEIAARSMFSLQMQHYGAALRRMIKDFAVRLGRPYFLDLMLPVGIPTPRDFGRRRFRARWIGLMDEIIAARLRMPAPEKPRDLFDLQLTARDPETGAAFSREQLRDQMATMIVAGHETTAITLFWSAYLMASARDEQERVAREVRDVDLGPDHAGDALQKLPYTRAVVSEALRLYPPAFTLARKAIGADEVAGVAVPAGSLVMISPWVLHHHVRFWKNPDAFDPSRFLRVPQPARHTYLPFGAGPRICIGAQFALAEAVLVLARLIQRFEVSLADTVPVLPAPVIVTQPDHPAPFRLRPRN